MHINHFRGETRVSVGRRRKFRPNTWVWYKRRWNRLYRRWSAATLDLEEDGSPASRYSRHQKTRMLYW